MDTPIILNTLDTLRMLNKNPSAMSNTLDYTIVSKHTEHTKYNKHTRTVSLNVLGTPGILDTQGMLNLSSGGRTILPST